MRKFADAKKSKSANKQISKPVRRRSISKTAINAYQIQNSKFKIHNSSKAISYQLSAISHQQSASSANAQIRK